MVYYNEIDPFAVAWLNELIKQGHIADGVVDARPIEEVDIDDLSGFDQCHFFAGIGGWSYALRLAGWPDDRQVWTGSCPCQPFSSAGKQKGFDDARHLWPVWANLIALGRPATIFGEQVASPAGLNWFDLVSADLEDQDYAVAAADLCAASIGSPHIRQRLYWVADSGSSGLEKRDRERGVQSTAMGAHAGETVERGIDPCGLGDSESQVRGLSLHERGPEQDRVELGGTGETRSRMADPNRTLARDSGLQRSGRLVQLAENPSAGFWSAADWLYCQDGKYRPVEPGTFPLAHGAPVRVGRLRGYGNAIVPQVAQAFIESFLAIN